MRPTTIDETKLWIKAAQNGSREVAKTFMRQGKSAWIGASLHEGWSYNLEEMARSIAYAHWVRDGYLPSIAVLDEVTLKLPDHVYFKHHGRQHLDTEVADIAKHRGIDTPRPYRLIETSERMTGGQ